MASSSQIAASNVASQIVPPASSDVAASKATSKTATSKVEDTKVLTFSQSVFGKANENASSALAYTATDSWCGKKSVKLIARTAVFATLSAGAVVEAAARAIIGIALKIVGFPLSFCKVNFLNNWADATLNSAKVTGQNAMSAAGSIFTKSAPKAESKPASSKGINNETLQAAAKNLKPTSTVVKGEPAIRQAPVENNEVENSENTDSWYPGKFIGQAWSASAAIFGG